MPAWPDFQQHNFLNRGKDFMPSVVQQPRTAFPIRLFLLFFLPLALLVMACAWYVGHDRIKGELGLIQADEINSIVLAVRRLDSELQVPIAQLRVLANEPVLSQAIDGTKGGLEQLGLKFMDLMAYNPVYDQIRWIDENGKEQVRVNNVEGRPARIAREGLQNKASRYYFKNSMLLKPGEIYVSPLDLNIENDVIEVPYKPTLRLASTVQSSDRRPHGILVLSVAARHLLDDFTESIGNKRDHVMLLNKQGFWLSSPLAADEWGFMFNRYITLGQRYPDAWKIISSRSADQVELADGLWTWSSIYPLKVADDSRIKDIPEWLVVSHLPASQLAMIRSNVWKPVITVSSIVIAVFGILSALLALAINGRHQAKIDAAKAQTEAEAAKALSNEKERYRMVVKANVNGLLVVDAEGRIVLTNPALDKMFGYNPDELLGKPLEILVPEAVHVDHKTLRTNFMSKPSARPMGTGRVLTGQRKGGEHFPLEVSLSPFKEGNRQYVGAVVCDISKQQTTPVPV